MESLKGSGFLRDCAHVVKLFQDAVAPGGGGADEAVGWYGA
jgi:hypothetical protein